MKQDWTPRKAQHEKSNFIVGVDSGVIEIARNPDHLAKGGEFYGKIQDLALWTAAAVWDGRKGAIRTPDGDGPHQVVYDPDQPYNFRDWRDNATGGFLVNLPRGEHGEPFTLYLGDVGRYAGEISFPEHKVIVFKWTGPMTLTFISDNRE